jgi:hypothetical protein
MIFLAYVASVMRGPFIGIHKAIPYNILKAHPKQKTSSIITNVTYAGEGKYTVG